MRNRADERDFDDLSVPDQIRHVQELWDRIADRPGDIKLTPAQRKELARRLRDHEQQPGETISWNDLRDRLLNEAG